MNDVAIVAVIWSDLVGGHRCFGHGSFGWLVLVVVVDVLVCSLMLI